MARAAGIFSLAFVLVGFTVTPAWAITRAEVDGLISRFGKAALIELVLAERAGAFTLAMPEGNVERYGRPNPAFVNSATLVEDLNKAGMDVTVATAALAALQEEQARESARLTRVIQSSSPLATFDPKMRIRGAGRSWTPKALIQDAEKVKRGWPDWLNQVRKQEAYRRNRAVEKVLLAMESKYGEADLKKAMRVADKRHYDEKRACRAIRNRARNPEYARQKCPETLRKQRPSAILRKQLSEPFRAFRKTMQPHIDRFLAERKIKMVY